MRRWRPWHRRLEMRDAVRLERQPAVALGGGLARFSRTPPLERSETLLLYRPPLERRAPLLLDRRGLRRRDPTGPGHRTDSSGGARERPMLRRRATWRAADPRPVAPSRRSIHHPRRRSSGPEHPAEATAKVSPCPPSAERVAGMHAPNAPNDELTNTGFMRIINDAKANAATEEAAAEAGDKEMQTVEGSTPPSLKLALERARERLPKDQTGRLYQYYGLLAPYSDLRTLGSDAAFYMAAIQSGFFFTLLAMLCTLPAMVINMGLMVEIDYEADYGPYRDEGMVTGIDPEMDKWTTKARWSDKCSLGIGAPLLWGRPGGNCELLGAQSLSWAHPICDLLALIVFIVFLCRQQRLLLLDDTVFRRVSADARAAARVRKRLAARQAKNKARGKRERRWSFTGGSGNADRRASTDASAEAVKRLQAITTTTAPALLPIATGPCPPIPHPPTRPQTDTGFDPGDRARSTRAPRAQRDPRRSGAGTRANLPPRESSFVYSSSRVDG